MRTLAVMSAMTYAVRRTEVRRTKVCGRKFNGRKLDGNLWTKVQRTKVRRRTFDESWAEVWRTSDESPTYVERVKLSCRCGDGGRRCYNAALRNTTTMAGNAVARNVVAALANNALQLAAFLRCYCSNAVLLRQRVGPCNVAATADNVLDLATVLRWPTTH
jgi:hypothetical protein